MKNKILFSFLCTSLFFSCQPSLHYAPDGENNLNLNSLVTLEIGEDTIHLQDFILNPTEIDSITPSFSWLQWKLSNDKKLLYVKVVPEMENFVDLKIWLNGTPYSIPCRKTDKTDFVFTYRPQGKTYRKVQIAGQMNDWVPNFTPDLQLNDSGNYQVTLHLSPGTYLYQMVLDGEWNYDVNNPLKIDNGRGKFNSILKVEGQQSLLPELYTDAYSDSKITLLSVNKVNNIFVYWQNYRLPDMFVKKQENRIIFDIPSEAHSLERSFIRVWVSNDFGVSNDVFIPLHKGKVLTNAKEITRSDKASQIIYFLMVDRFKNGNKDNDHPLRRADVHPKVDFWGGDLAGIRQKIDDRYFTDLGVNTLWISPVNQNPTTPYGFYAPVPTKFSGYHGYWPISSSKVDFRFGTNNELKNLVVHAHSNNINILLDYVAHHVHEEHPLYKEHPEFFTSLYLPDGTLNTERWDDQRLTTWFDTFMPTLNTTDPKVIDLMTDSALFWLKEFQLDGFRHDACKHISNDFWRELTLKIKRQNHGKNLYQIGETYGSPQLIGSFLCTGMLDGQFDFNVFDEASVAFAGIGGNSLSRVNDVLQNSFKVYGHHNLMGYISGNHDRPRFMAYASGDLKYGEDTKLAGWKREIGISDSTAYDKMFLLHTFNLTIPGIPVIYYGDEIGMTGANDPDCRRMMRFDHWNKREQNLWKKVSTLTHLRLQHPVLIYGDFVSLQANNDSWVYARKYFDKVAIIFINNAPKSQHFEINLPSIMTNTIYQAVFQHAFTEVNGTINIDLPAYSAEILLN